MHLEHGALPAMASVVFQADTPWSIKDGLMMYHSLKAMHGIALMFIQVCVSYLEKCMSQTIPLKHNTLQSGCQT
jgi:hypothetical protein